MTAEQTPQEATREILIDEELKAIFTGDPGAAQDPYPVWNRLREESPIHRYDAQTWLVARHADVLTVYKDDANFPAKLFQGTRFEGQLSQLSEAELKLMDEFRRFEQNTLSRKNGADHHRVRAAANRYFAPRRTAGLEPELSRILEDLIEEWREAGNPDFMPVAYKLPLYAITEMLGVPRQDAEKVKSWGDFFLATAKNPIPPEVVHRKKGALDAYRNYVDELIERHRADPDANDLVTSVLDAAAGDRLDEEELVAFFLHTLMAGHETTQHMIGNGIRNLLLNRDQWDALREDPSLAAGAVEEILRWDPPVPFIGKRAIAGATVDGVPIPEEATVLLLQVAANRDPAVFEDPETFDIRRKPNDQVTFGRGVHFCLGASLARLEGRIVLETLVRRFPRLDFAVDPDEIHYHYRGIRGLDELPLELGREHRPAGSS